jgi:hypothetical protein
VSKRNIWEAADSLQNARDHLVVARASRGIQRDHDINCARENIREVMDILGIKEAPNNGN